jgi:hypothetical protein
MSLSEVGYQLKERGQIIQNLETALAHAYELGDGNILFLIERALDEARSRPFRPPSACARLPRGRAAVAGS